MFRSFVKVITFFFFVLAGVTWVAGEAGVGITGRLIAADLLGVVIILLFGVVCMFKRKGRFLITKTHLAFVGLFLSFFVSGVFASFPDKAMFELIILLFIFLVSISLLNLWTFVKLDIEEVLKLVLWAGALLSIVGLLQFFIFTSLFQGAYGGLSGTFRNTGQAGAFFSTFLALLIPAFLTGKIESKPHYLLLLFLILLALIFTFKRAALIGVIAGFLFILLKFVISNNMKEKLIAARIFLVICFISPILIVLISWGADNVDGMLWRMEKKISGSSIEKFSEGFLAQNIRYTLKAFEINPVIGVGLGNVAGVISSKYEIHSTYMAVLATGGIVGVALYFVFMGTWIRSLLRKTFTNQGRNLLVLITLMVLGLMISWGYTYHIRKREFWIVLTITLFIQSTYKSNKINGFFKR